MYLSIVNRKTGLIKADTDPIHDTSVQTLSFDNDGEESYLACFESPDTYPKTIRIIIDHIKREEYVTVDSFALAYQYLAQLSSEQLQYEGKLYKDNMNLKRVGEQLSKSQKTLTLAYFVKAFIFLMYYFSSFRSVM